MIRAALLFFSLLSFAPSSQAGAPGDAAYAHRAFQEVLLRCPERVWPGVQWRELQLLFSSPGPGPIWLVSAQGPPEILPKDQTLDDLFQPGFTQGVLDFRGRRTVAVNTEGLSDQRAFRAAVRELFRHEAQGLWDNSAHDERGVLFPPLAEPRYLRRMAFESLKRAQAALGTRRDHKPHLSAAAYWLRLWQHRYPEELPLQTDGLEGTALYVEQAGYLFAESGCPVRGKEIFPAYTRYVGEEMALLPADLPAREGAVMGALSSFLLTSLRPSWFAQMSKGSVSPAALLLQDVPMARQPHDEKLLVEYRAETDRQFRKARRKLRRFFDQEQDDDYVRVAIPHTWQKGSIPIEESYVLRDRRDTSLHVLGEEADFAEEQGAIHLPGRAVIAQTPRNPCGGHFHFLIPARSISQQGSRFTGSHDFRGLAFRGGRKNVAGFSWICPRE